MCVPQRVHVLTVSVCSDRESVYSDTERKGCVVTQSVCSDTKSVSADSECV